VHTRVAKLAKREDLHGSGPVRYRIDGPPEAPTGAIIAIDYTEAPVPNHYYVADYFQVFDQDPQILFVFGKTDFPETGRLRNKLEIYFPSYFFVKQLWISSRAFHEALRRFTVDRGYSPVPAGTIPGTTEKVQTLHSNNVLMVQSGGECMMDFFYLSPRDFYLKTQKKQNVDLEALVRVIISHTLLLGFLDACEPIAQALATKYESDENAGQAVESGGAS
jgi:hypothetical protein